jgi:uncharacterized protein
MSKFQPITFYESGPARQPNFEYQLLPFRFSELDHARYVLTNVAGEYLVVNKEDVHSFANHTLPSTSATYINLRARHFLADSHSKMAPDLLAIKLRTRSERLADFTSLHIFVVTLRCEHSCPYCQVSRQSEDKDTFDMSIPHANASIALTMRSPAKNLKIEFQGGESLLNFELIRHVVIEAKRVNAIAAEPKHLGFVIATNLAVITDDILSFCKLHDIVISTSLDGPKELHNKNRPRPGHDSYERAVAGIDRARNYLGRDKVSALMTTTEAGLNQVEAIIDEYVDRNFTGIFLRPLSPYGFAIKTKFYRAYNTQRWLDFYIKGLEYIIELNRQGVEFREHYAATILTKMLTSSDPGYVDLMSPAGTAIGAVVYNYDGSVYASDESRMLAEMGDQKFRLGNVLDNTYEEIFLNETLLEALEDSFAQSTPMCTDCAFEPFCGSDPVFHWGQHGDLVGRKTESEFCQRNMSIFKYLIDKMESDRFTRALFLKWAN